jgi:hypothetical protein
MGIPFQKKASLRQRFTACNRRRNERPEEHDVPRRKCVSGGISAIIVSAEMFAMG